MSEQNLEYAKQVKEAVGNIRITSEKMVLFFSYRVVNNAMNKILVINEGGEFVHFKAMQTDKLFESLLKSHCYYTAYYLNSFDLLFGFGAFFHC